MEITLLRWDDPGFKKVSRQQFDDLRQLGRFAVQHDWSCAVYRRCRGNASASGIRRWDTVALDFDENVTLEQAEAAFAHLDHVTVTTKSHRIEKDGKPACDRFRVIFPLARPVTDPDEHSATRAKLEALCPGADPNSRAPSKSWFASSRGPNGRIWRVVEGRQRLEPVPAAPRVEDVHLPTEIKVPTEVHPRLLKLAETFAATRRPSVNGGGGRIAMLNLVADLVHDCLLPDDVAVHMVLTHYNPRSEAVGTRRKLWTRKEVEAWVRWSRKHPEQHLYGVGMSAAGDPRLELHPYLSLLPRRAAELKHLEDGEIELQLRKEFPRAGQKACLMAVRRIRGRRVGGDRLDMGRHPITVAVQAVLATAPDRVTVDDLLLRLALPDDTRSRNNVGRALAHLGWVRRRTKAGYHYAPGEEAEALRRRLRRPVSIVWTLKRSERQVDAEELAHLRRAAAESSPERLGSQDGAGAARTHVISTRHEAAPAPFSFGARLLAKMRAQTDEGQGSPATTVAASGRTTTWRTETRTR